MTALALRSAAEYSLAEIAVAVVRSFEGYFVPIAMDRAHLLTMARADSVDLVESRIVLADGAAAGAALIARRGWTSRVAAMGIVPEWRGRGLGKSMMNALTEDAHGRRDREMVLEVIVQNEPAVRLYESFGFKKVRRLVGLTAESRGADDCQPPAQIDIRQLARLIATDGLMDLPWQLSAETIAQYGPPFRAYTMGGAYALVSDTEGAEIAFRSLLVESSARHAGIGQKLIQTLLACEPGKKWRVPAIYPEEIVGVFESAGFRREKLAQWQMSCRVAA